MSERKWFKGRPIRRTKAKAGMVKVIFDDGPKGLPGDTVTVPEEEYAATVRRVFSDPPASADGQRERASAADTANRPA